MQKEHVEQTSRFQVDLLEDIHSATFDYFWVGSHPVSGLPRDRMRADGSVINEIASVSGIGFGLMAILVGTERGWVSREQACDRALKILRCLSSAPKFHGALPHFLHAETLEVIPFGKRDDGADLVETAFLMQGVICLREYFSSETPADKAIRDAANGLIGSVEWNWFTRGTDGPLYWHWSPRHRWARNVPITGWNEALVAYVLAAGADNYSISSASYHAGWARHGEIVNGKEYLGTTLPLGEPFGGPLFLSQYSFCGLKPFGLKDRYCNYQKQVEAHAWINHDYCRSRFPDTPIWGMTACDGPKGYRAFSPTVDGGVIAPTAALSSFPTLPHQAQEAMEYFASYEEGKLIGRYGFIDAFSPTTGWKAETHLATNQGPIVAMMENYRSGLLWRLFMAAPEVQRGLDILGFTWAGKA